MIDLKNVKFNGESNQADGYSFSFIQSEHGYKVVSLLIDTIRIKNKPLKIAMNPERNHTRPHIHIGKCRIPFFVDNGAIALKPSGPNRGYGLNGRYEREILDWINAHRTDLYNIWDSFEKGGQYDDVITHTRTTWEENGVFFDGLKPKNEIEISDVRIWYNGNLEHEIINHNNKIICTKEMCVLLPKDFQEGSMEFYSEVGSVQIKKQ